ncbi:MAG: 2-phosphosulfolactate phosphatase [Gemmatimonadota bacterium]|nr:2-phosphosulfolactate phosphatase [Gemmatimonadota bacterium]
MKIDTYFTVEEVDPPALATSIVVVIDVVRATTTMTEALAQGAGSIYPTGSTEEAVKLASSLGREDTLLCGERKGAKVEGFDLGNSPGEYTKDAVSGKRLVMSTTNGTRALVAGAEGERVLACAFTNLGAVTDMLSDATSLAILCAGREDQFSLEDALCAGHLIERIVASRSETPELNDASRASRALAGSLQPSRAFLSETTAGRALVEIGLGDDLDLCAEVDRHAIVPEMQDKAITLPRS